MISMKRLVLLSLCCCLLLACSIRNTNNNCDSVLFKNMLNEYFPCFIFPTDTFKSIYCTNFSEKDWYHINKDSSYSFLKKYASNKSFVNSGVVFKKDACLLSFNIEIETDTCQYVTSRFLLCDTCGEILDSLCIRTYDGGATYDKAFDHENFSDFYVDKNSLVWLYYKSFYDHDTVTCMKTVYDITETKIKQKDEIQEYKLTHQDYLKGWKGWK